ncbi:MAG: hypothetical protein KA886_00805 [Candidatus Cloacimonetes bacterium]|nr:hypothetical protein [Candidatus Cloacimonadota bacterium]
MVVSEDEIILRSTDLTTTMVSTICDHGIRITKRVPLFFMIIKLFVH